MTLAEFVETAWLPKVKDQSKIRTVSAYESALRRVILPALGPRRLADLRRRDVKDMLLAIPGPASRARALSIVSSIFAEALEDEVPGVEANPCTGLGKSLRLGKRSRKAGAKALDAAQLGHLLGTATAMVNAGTLDPIYPPLLAVLSLAGLRPGEGLALRWDDWNGSSLTIRRTWHPVTCGTTKTGRERIVDVRPNLAALLDGHRSKATSPWMFTLDGEKPLTISSLQKALKRILTAAKLPASIHPHSMRHSFASQLLAKGESMQFVQRQLGHSSISMTVDVYGSALPVERKVAGVLE